MSCHLLAVLALLFAASTATATVAVPAPQTRLTAYGLFGGAHNPFAIAGFVGIEKRTTYSLSNHILLRDLYYQWGAELLLTGLFRPAVFAEWSPLRILKLRAQYELWLWPGFHLGRGHGLIFDGPNAPFGEAEIQRRQGEEIPGVGHRAVFSPTLQLKVWRVIVVNTLEMAAWYVHGADAYWREPLYDNLIKRGSIDGTLKNHALLLFELWALPQTDRRVLFGGTFEVVHTLSAAITRHRLGLALIANPFEELLGFDRPTLFVLAGINTRDRNREDELWVNIGLRLDLDL